MNIDDEYIKECTRIDGSDLEYEFVRVPSDIAFWNDRFAEALTAFEEAKISRKRMEAARRKEIRDILEVSNAKGRVTISEVESELWLDPQYLDSVKVEADAEVEKVRVRGIVEAVQAKKDMLLVFGGYRRAEMEQGLYIKASDNNK